MAQLRSPMVTGASAAGRRARSSEEERTSNTYRDNDADLLVVPLERALVDLCPVEFEQVDRQRSDGGR